MPARGEVIPAKRGELVLRNRVQRAAVGPGSGQAGKVQRRVQHVRAHARKRDDAGGECGADLGVHVLERRRDLRELGEPAQIRNAVAQLPGADPGERLGVEETRPEASVVDDEIEFRPVVRDLRQIARGSLLGRVRRGRREPLVDADVEEARMLFQLFAVVPDELVSGISDLLVVEPPRSEEHTSELQSLAYLVCRLLLEKKKKNHNIHSAYEYA